MARSRLEWKFPALLPRADARRSEKRGGCERMIGAHHDANADVASHHDVDLRYRSREKAEADIGALIRDPCDHVGRRQHGNIEMQARIAAAEIGDQLWQK